MELKLEYELSDTEIHEQVTPDDSDPLFFLRANRADIRDQPHRKEKGEALCHQVSVCNKNIALYQPFSLAACGKTRSCT
jgi:hypothetical protein